MKKVLVSGMTKNLGGVEKFIVSNCKNISSPNVKFDFVITDEKCVLSEEIINMNSKIYRITQGHFKHPYKFKNELKKIIDEGKYDAIWVNDCSLNSFHYIKLAKKYGVKTRIIHSHNSQNMDTSFKGRLKYLVHLANKLNVGKYATHYWACSKLAAQFFYRPKLMPKVTIINNGIDTNKFKFDSNIREKIRKEFGIEQDYVLGHVGRFHFQKNHMFLLKIFKEYIKRDDTAKLLLIGDGEDRKKIEEYIRENELGEKVILTGIRNDIEEIMQAMDIFLLPSLFEGLPIVGVEAQCAGLACIFSDKITTEVQLTENVDYLPIGENDYNKWIELIENIKKTNKDRTKAEKIIKEKGYDITEETLKLRKFFEEI